MNNVTAMITNIEVIAELVLAFFTFLMAVGSFLMVREVIRDRRLRVIERRLKDFYIPLITEFTSTNPKDGRAFNRVENIIVGRRYLCTPRTLEILPEHFEAIRGAGPQFKFPDKATYDKWVKVVDALWEEAMKLVKEYYKTGGIKKYTIPQKLKWSGLSH